MENEKFDEFEDEIVPDEYVGYEELYWYRRSVGIIRLNEKEVYFYGFTDKRPKAKVIPY